MVKFIIGFVVVSFLIAVIGTLTGDLKHVDFGEWMVMLGIVAVIGVVAKLS